MNKHIDVEAQLRGLPDMANTALGGLTAGKELQTRIQMAAREARAPKRQFSLMKLIPAGAALCAAAVALFIGLGAMKAPATQPLIQTNALGPSAPPVVSTSSPVLTGDLRNGDVTVRSGSGVPEYRSIWSKSSNGSFPLIAVEGRYYRMLTSPRSVSSRLLGKELGTISEYTTEPSLSGNQGLMSNKAAFDTPVYEVDGMEGTLIAAEVDGQMRLFQRVSFNGNALKGRESLEDTLDIRGRVISMELSGVGTINDASTCERLLRTLLSCASYESSGSLNASQSLLIELDNGLVLQLAVKNDRLAACGTWSCPEFIEEFENACE